VILRQCEHLFRSLQLLTADDQYFFETHLTPFS
ncbi:MAG: hypothetical protein ACI8VR_001937, partial [Candidatus Azotimanducaceae bacterium]